MKKLFIVALALCFLVPSIAMADQQQQQQAIVEGVSAGAGLLKGSSYQ